MSELKRIDVRIDGQEFTIKSSEKEEHVREIEEYINNNIKRINDRNLEISKNMIYILANFNITDQFLKNKDELEEYKEEVRIPLETSYKTKVELDRLKEKYDARIVTENRMKDEILEIRRELEIFRRKNKEQEETIKIKTKQVLESEKVIKELQDKIFKEQVEKINLKKDLKNL